MTHIEFMAYICGNRTVNRIAERARKLQERIVADKQKMVEELDKYLDELARRNGLKHNGQLRVYVLYTLYIE